MSALQIPPQEATASAAIPRYRNELKKVIPAHFLKPDNWNLLWFIPHGTIIGVSLWLLTAHFSWWTAPFLSILIGHSFGCLGFLAHEICHGGGIKNKKLRHLLAGIGFSAFGIGPLLWSKWHNTDHHNNTQVVGVDPDHLFTIEDYKHNPVLKFLYRLTPLARNLVIFSSFAYRMTQHNFRQVIAYVRDPRSTPRDRAAIIFQFIFPLTLWIAGTALLGWPVFLFGYVLPMAVANAIAISYIATNHFLNPLADESDVLGSSLSVTMPKGMGWIDGMHSYFGAHVAHHLFPTAPSRYNRKIERYAAELWPDRYHEMTITRALKLLWDTPWIYDEKGTELIDPRRHKSSPTLGHGLERMIKKTRPDKAAKN